MQHENFMKIRSFTLRKGNWLYFERHIWEGDRDKFLPRERQKVVVTWAPPGPISNVQIASLSVQVWKRKLKKFSLVYALIPSKSKIPRPDVLISLKICLNTKLIFSLIFSKIFKHKKEKKTYLKIKKKFGKFSYGRTARSEIRSEASSSSAPVSCHSTWTPSNFLLSASLELALTIRERIFDFSGAHEMNVS